MPADVGLVAEHALVDPGRSQILGVELKVATVSQDNDALYDDAAIMPHRREST